MAVLLAVLLLITACESDVDLSAEWKDVTVIHGFVEDGYSPGFAVRISRAFLGDKPISEMAAVPDSANYTEPMEVTIQEFYKGYAVSYEMERDTVDGFKKPDIFPAAGNIWYFTTLRINPEKTYKLIVYFPLRDKFVSATTHCIQRPHIAEPARDNSVISLADRDRPFQVGYFTRAYGEYYRISLIFHYREAYTTYGKTAEDRSFQFDLLPKIIDPAPLPFDYPERITRRVPYESLYSELGNGIPVDSTIRIRYLKGVDVRLFVGTHEYNLYYHSGSEFEFSNTRNRFTNVVNGAGIFSSVGFKYVVDLIPDQRSLDSLAFGRLTGHLKFTNEILKP